MESDFDLDIELSLFTAALAIIFILLCITLSYYHIMISMLLQAVINMGFYVRYKVFFMELHGFLCGIDDVSGPIRLHHLLQV